LGRKQAQMAKNDDHNIVPRSTNSESQMAPNATFL
jgi:hypothetical protein